MFTKKDLTPGQYKRTNRIMISVLVVVYGIYMLVEWGNKPKVEDPTFIYLRMGVYFIIGIVTILFYMKFYDKKIDMLFMAISYTVVYGIMMFSNSSAMMALVFPVITAMMLYLNAILIVSGVAIALVMCIIRMCIFYNTGMEREASKAIIIIFAMGLCLYGAWRAINLLISFSKEESMEVEKKVIEQKEVADVVSDIVVKLEADFNEVVKDLADISEAVDTSEQAMDNIADSSENTAEAVSNQAQQTNQIQERLEKAGSMAQTATDITTGMMDTIEDGVKYSGELHKQSELVDENITNIKKTVADLVNKVQSVSSITESILNISSQTNLLALNASIEAARAGEAGRGFAVVADEIRGLAEETRVSTEKISEIISELISVTNKTSEGLEVSVQSINEQRNMVENVNKSFMDTGKGMKVVEDNVVNMNNEIEVVLEANKEIVDSISLLSATTEQVSAGAAVSRENIEEVAVKLRGFSAVIDDTFEQLKNLKETVSK